MHFVLYKETKSGYMVLTSTALENFIAGFKITKENNQVCFTAHVDIKYGEKEIQTESKVVIVNAVAKERDTIYLLNTHLIAMGFPEVFRSDRDFFSYYNGKYLIINGKDRYLKNYIVLIHPRSQSCHEN